MSSEALTIEFRDLEDMHNTQVDLIQILQASLNSETRNDGGYHTLTLIETLAGKIYKVGNDAENEIKNLKHSLGCRQ